MFAIGVFPVSCGGDIAFRLGIAQIAVKCMLAREDADGMLANAKARNLSQDNDVLDTWFSSALWPFSTLGWPERNGGFEAFLSDRCACNRLRYHLFLGSADDLHGAWSLRSKFRLRMC